MSDFSGVRFVFFLTSFPGDGAGVSSFLLVASNICQFSSYCFFVNDLMGVFFGYAR